jgi:hypothetical protein
MRGNMVVALPPKMRRPLFWVWTTMMILALLVAIGYAFFK